MSRFFCRFMIEDGDQQIPYYFEWSEAAKMPVTFGMLQKTFLQYVKEEYGNQGMRDLAAAMPLLDEFGNTSSKKKPTKELVKDNKCGGDKSLALERIQHIWIFCPECKNTGKTGKKACRLCGCHKRLQDGMVVESHLAPQADEKPSESAPESPAEPNVHIHQPPLFNDPDDEEVEFSLDSDESAERLHLAGELGWTEINLTTQGWVGKPSEWEEGEGFSLLPSLDTLKEQAESVGLSLPGTIQTEEIHPEKGVEPVSLDKDEVAKGIESADPDDDEEDESSNHPEPTLLTQEQIMDFAKSTQDAVVGICLLTDDEKFRDEVDEMLSEQDCTVIWSCEFPPALVIDHIIHQVPDSVEGKNNLKPHSEKKKRGRGRPKGSKDKTKRKSKHHPEGGAAKEKVTQE